jgi:hypothetical protein
MCANGHWLPLPLPTALKALLRCLLAHRLPLRPGIKLAKLPVRPYGDDVGGQSTEAALGECLGRLEFAPP